MNSFQKFGGAAIVTAVLLMLTRMIPIFASGAISFQEFPPNTIAATANLATVARRGWELSHLMLLASLVLFFTGYLVLYTELQRQGQKNLGHLFIITLGSGLLFYAIAGVVDGFLVPFAANQSGLMSELPANAADMLVAFGHETAIAFFGQAQTGIVLGIGLVSVALWRAKLLSRWLTATGAGLSGLALLGLLAGVFGDYWRTFETTGPVMMLFFLWQLALGIAMLIKRPASAKAPHPRLQDNPASTS